MKDSARSLLLAQNTPEEAEAPPAAEDSSVEESPQVKVDPVEPKEKEAPLVKWSCELKEDETYSFKPLSEFTVGNMYMLICQGPALKDRPQPPVKIEFEKEEAAYSLVSLREDLLDYERAQLIVTGYKPGSFSNHKIKVIAANQVGFESQVNFKVNSVIEPNKENPMQPPQAYGPYGPMTMALPLYYWLSWGFAALLVLSLVAYKFKRHLDRKRLMESLETHATALSPINQFNKELRNLARQQFDEAMKSDQPNFDEYLKNLEYVFRLYLSRELTVPALDWSSGQVLRDIKSRHKRVFEDCGRDIRRLFDEFDKAKTLESGLSPEDCEQLMEMSRDLAARVSFDVRLRR